MALTLQFLTPVRIFTTLQVAVSSCMENVDCGTHLPLAKVLWCSPGLQCVSSENRSSRARTQCLILELYSWHQYFCAIRKMCSDSRESRFLEIMRPLQVQLRARTLPQGNG